MKDVRDNAKERQIRPAKDQADKHSPDAKVQAIVVADLHFSASPVARAEKGQDWFKVTEYYWKMVEDAARIYGRVPIIVAGDIFDKWNPSPEVINAVMSMMSHPEIYAIPGQHDLPYHRYADLHKSAYWTLVQAKKIIHMPPTSMLRIGNLRVHPFPFGTDIVSPKTKVSGYINVAICHKYIWSDNKNSFVDAPRENFISNIRDSVEGYTVAVFGDNHQGFTFRLGKYTPGKEFLGTRVLNCGGFMCRNSDQKEYRPRIGFIWSDGLVSSEYMPLNDKWLDRQELKLSENLELDQFMSVLAEESDITFDFPFAIKSYFLKNKIPKIIQAIVLKALEDKV